MSTLNNILEEIKDVPPNRLEELYQLVHSLTPHAKSTDTLRKLILSYGGAFSDMNDDDYEDYLIQTQKTRNHLNLSK